MIRRLSAFGYGCPLKRVGGMIMKKKTIYAMLLAMTAGFIFAGCGDGVGEVGLFVQEEVEHPPVSVEAQPVNAPPEVPEQTEEQGIHILYHTGELTEEEEQAVLDAMQGMYQNLRLEEYLGEGIHDISSEEWMGTFNIRMVEGSRTYYLQENGETLLSVQAGCDTEGKAIANVFCQVSDTKVILLRQAGSVTQLVRADVAGGQYDGAYELWQFDGETGSIRHEEGTCAAGLTVGEYVISEREGTAESSAYDLWNNREGMEYKVTTLKYDNNGELIPEATPVPTVTPKPTATPKPEATPRPAATPKPAATPRPAATPAPTQAPAPEPEPDDNNDADNDDGGNQNDGGSQNNGGSQDNGGGDSSSGGNDSGGNGSGGGADVDVEWSGDIL